MEICTYTKVGFSFAGNEYDTGCDQEADEESAERWTYCPYCGKQIRMNEGAENDNESRSTG
jgi:hypothetical protein